MLAVGEKAVGEGSLLVLFGKFAAGEGLLAWRLTLKFCVSLQDPHTWSLNTVPQVAEEGHLKTKNSQEGSAGVCTGSRPRMPACGLGSFPTRFCIRRQYLAVEF